MVKLSVYGIFSLGSLMALLSLYLRSELSNPNLLPITETFGGGDPLNFYTAISHLHGGVGTALYFFVAAFMAFLARGNNARVAHAWGYIALVLAATQIIVGLWEFLSHVAPNITPHMPHIIENHNAEGARRPLQLLVSENYLQVAALTLVLLAAASTMCTTMAYRIGSAVLIMLTILTFVFYTYFFIRTHSTIGLSLYIMPEVGLLALLAVVMIDPNRTDMPYLTVGIGLILLSGLAFDLLSTITSEIVASDSYFYIANKHLAQHGLLVFAFFNAWSDWKSTSDDRGLEWLHAGALGFGFLLTYVPLILIGQRGGLRHNPNSAVDFPDLNYLATLGGYTLVILAVLGIFIPNYRKLRR